ncbi:MAG: hypothetical protein NTV14_06015 [Coprothermobacterota bacterium]|nr:hypothetical protein [Coprothermobacterota bacterium]
MFIPLNRKTGDSPGTPQKIQLGASSSSGLPNSFVHCLAIGTINHRTFYAGTWGGGVFKSMNGGV